MKNKVPNEEHESIAFVNWLKLMDLPHHHSANEQPAQKISGRRPNGKPIWSPNWSTLRRLKNMGVARGFPDYLVWVPKGVSRSNKALLLAIEMKTAKGRVSKEQNEWLKTIGQVENCEGFVCRGFEEAKAKVEEFIN